MPKRVPLLVSLLAALAGATASAQPTAAPLSDSFDGTWFVALDCADTTDRSGFVKGYQFEFDVRIAHGLLDGRRGDEGLPSSVHFAGEVREGGVLEIRADGVTGANEYSVGRVARGTSYRYTMAGRLDGTHGQAARREVRPCTATFVKRDAALR